PVHQIFEGDVALDLGEDRPGIRIPLGDTLTALNLVAVLDTQACTVRDTVMRAFSAVRVDYRDDHVANHRNNLVVRVLGDILALELHLAVEIRLDERLLGDLRRTANMEGAHRELGTRFADRLSGNDTHSLAHVDRRAAGQIASVAGSAHTVLGLTGKHRPNAQLLHTGVGNLFDLGLFQQRSPL